MITTAKLDSFLIVKGSADADKELLAFDRALIMAKVNNVNLIKISSILPPNASQIIEFKLTPACLLPIAYSYRTSSIVGEQLAASVAVGIPTDKSNPGVIMEYSYNGSAKVAEEKVRWMAEEALRTRNYGIKEILSTSIDHVVHTCGCAFAGVALVNREIIFSLLKP